MHDTVLVTVIVSNNSVMVFRSRSHRFDPFMSRGRGPHICKYSFLSNILYHTTVTCSHSVLLLYEHYFFNIMFPSVPASIMLLLAIFRLMLRF